MIAVWPWPLSRVARAIARVGEYLVERRGEVFWRWRASRLKDALLFALADLPHAADCPSDNLLGQHDCDCWRSTAMEALDSTADVNAMTEMRDLRDEVEAWPATLREHPVTLEVSASHERIRAHCHGGRCPALSWEQTTPAAFATWVRHVEDEVKKARGPF